MIKSIVLTLLLLTSVSHAVPDLGTVVTCMDETGKISHSELLEYYEFQQQGKTIHIDASIPQSELFSFRHEVFMALSMADLEFAMMFSMYQYLANLAEDFEHMDYSYLGYFLTTSPIPVNPEIKVDNLPEGCELRTLYLFFEDEGFPDYFLINSEIWSTLEPKSRAGFVFNESFYSHVKKILRTRDRLQVKAFHLKLVTTPLKEFFANFNQHMKTHFPQYNDCRISSERPFWDQIDCIYKE